MERIEMEKFGQRISALRKESGETQESLLNALGVTQQTLSRYEKGERQASLEFVIKAARHYNVSSDYLLGLSDAKSTEQEIQTACSVTGLSEEAIKALQEIASDTEHKYSAENALSFLNTLLEDSSSPYSISPLANMMKKIVDTKIQILQTDKLLGIARQERNETGRKMTAYEIGAAFSIVDLREQEDLALLRFSRVLNALAESIAKEEIEQEESHGKHNQTEE